LKQGAIDFFDKLFDVDPSLASSRAALMGGNKSNDEFISVYRRRLAVTEVVNVNRIPIMTPFNVSHDSKISRLCA
jgi:hypothetical protein